MRDHTAVRNFFGITRVNDFSIAARQVTIRVSDVLPMTSLCEVVQTVIDRVLAGDIVDEIDISSRKCAVPLLSCLILLFTENP